MPHATRRSTRVHSSIASAGLVAAALLTANPSAGAAAGQDWLAQRASEVAATPTRLSRQLREHLTFETLRKSFEAAVAAAGVEMVPSSRTFGAAPADWPGLVFIAHYEVAGVKLAVTFNEPPKAARTKRYAALRAAAITGDGWQHLAVTTDDVGTTSSLRATVRKVVSMAA